MMKSHWKKKLREKKKYRWEYNENANPPVKLVVKSFAELKARMNFQDDTQEAVQSALEQSKGSLMK